MFFNPQINSIIPINKVYSLDYFIPKDDQTSQNYQKCLIDWLVNFPGTYAKNLCLSCGDLKTFKD